MKQILLLFITIASCCSVGQMNAQCKDCFQNENDWKFAAGVTIYSNNHYFWDENILERQPLEFNFIYKIKSSHVLRLSLPILYKVNKSGTPSPSQYPNGEVSLEDYIDKLRDPDYTWASYHKVLNYTESLYGASIGYDYDLVISDALSVFAGLNFAYNYMSTDSKYYTIDYHELDNEYKSSLGIIALREKQLYRNGLSLTPLIGFRYHFQKLLFEANIGSVFGTHKAGSRGNYSSIYKSGIIDNKYYHFPKVGIYKYNYLLYNMSIFYKF